MDLVIRPEELMDIQKINEVVKEAFYREDKAEDFNEWGLVKNIRNSIYFIKELSLVAEIDKEIVGHIMFTPMEIIDGKKMYKSLALAPLSVVKTMQNRGIGSELIKTSIEKAKDLGYDSIIVMGHPTYYKKFGFDLAYKFGIGFDNDFKNEYLFALELKENALSKVKGNIKYCKPFYSATGELI